MSATIDTEKLENFFTIPEFNIKPSIFEIEGKMHKVDIVYDKFLLEKKIETEFFKYK